MVNVILASDLSRITLCPCDQRGVARVLPSIETVNATDPLKEEIDRVDPESDPGKKEEAEPPVHEVDISVATLLDGSIELSDRLHHVRAGSCASRLCRHGGNRTRLRRRLLRL